MLALSCTRCNEIVLLYQKDGPGPLLRCYFDRIHAPKSFMNLQKKKDYPKTLLCPSCKTLLGTTAIYEKENRLAFFLEETSLHSLFVEPCFWDQFLY